MWPSILFILIAYLLGSLSGSLLLGRLRGVDIRTVGSGNAGGTNALRTQGFKFALGTVLVDVGKGVLAAWLAWRQGPQAMLAWLPYACVLAAVIGHIWPLFHGFRGGKGGATLLGGLLVIWPWALPLLLAAWGLTLMCTGYVGLSTILAAASLIATALLGGDGSERFVFAVSVALLIAYTHRSNIQRLRAGTEPRAERARLIGRWFSRKLA